MSLGTLNSFTSEANNGGFAAADLTLVGSTLFGVTADGGSSGDGTLFSMNLDGSNYQVLHTFTGGATDGANASGGLTLVGSTLFGTTAHGGADNDGTVFSINTDGSDYQVLHTFTGVGADGIDPYSGLTLVGSTLMGTTVAGGSNYGGTVFSIDTDGSDFQTVYSFAVGESSAWYPQSGLTVVGSTLFGTSYFGGSNDTGTLYSMNINGSGFQIVHSFLGNTMDGELPTSGLTVVGSTLIGTTEFADSGVGVDGTIFSINTDGSDYQLLHVFTGNDSDGEEPFASPTLVGSTLFGTTVVGGSNGQGTLYSMNPDGSDYQVLYSFPSGGTAAEQPDSALTLVGSTLFGASGSGGSAGFGAVFSVSGATPSFIVTPSNSSADYAVGGPAVAVDAGVALNSTATDLTGATVTISASTLQAGDLLNFANQNGISGSYDGASGVLTLTGSATPAQYQAALQSVTFSATSSNTTPRAISIVALDGELASNTAAEQVVINAPVVTPSGTISEYLVGGTAVAVDPGLSVGYSGTDLTGATVTISASTLQAGDTLNFANQNGISGSYNSGTGVLTLSGSATVVEYQAALQSLTFSSSSPSTATRSLSIVAIDGSLDSNVAAESVTIGFAVPVLTVPYQPVHLFNQRGNTSYPQANLILVGSTLYGTAYRGGSDDEGTVFSMNTDGSDYHILYSFGQTGTDAAYPFAGLTLVGSTLFGTTAGGGSASDGTIFSINTDGSDYQVLYSFTGSGSDGANPMAGLTLVGSTLYGTTEYGGTDNQGTIFSIHTDGSGYQVLYSFLDANPGTDGANPVAGLTAVGSTLYGTTEDGGTDNQGTIFSIHADGSGYQALYSFLDVDNGSDGANPLASLTAVGSALYGTTEDGGIDNQGTIFSIHTDGSGYQVLYSFLDTGSDGANPAAGLTLDGSTLFGTTEYGGTGGDGTIFAINTDGTGYDTLYSFTGTGDDGANPTAGLTLDGSILYGTTENGGSNSAGTLFSLNTDGSAYTDLQSFGDFASDGVNPVSGLTLVGSTLFGTTPGGGGDYDGTIYSMNADGSDYQLLYSFTGTGSDGSDPVSGLTLVGSTLFGTTEDGGSDGDGTIFSINTDGTGYKVLYSFTGTGGVGANPTAALTLVGSTLFGTTEYGGTGGDGTIFAINTDGTGYNTLYSFTGTGDDGANPVAGLTLDGSTLFGTTENGGGNAEGTVFSINTDGKDYQVLHWFTGVDGMYSVGGLTLAGSTLYGTTENGGNDHDGTIYSINANGTDSQVLHTFSWGDGGVPLADLTLVGSTLFGTTEYGGSGGGNGTVFSINTDGSQFQNLHTFTYSDIDGGSPEASLTLDGSTLLGTARWSESSSGSVFSISDISIYTVGGPAVAVDQGVTVTLASTITNLDGATMTISPATLQSGDTLNFVDQNGITGSYNSGSGVLTLTGSATPAQYQTALQSITFSSTSPSPITRTISTTTYDGGGTQASSSLYEQVIVASSEGSPPVVTTSASTGQTYTLGGSAVAVDSGVTVTSTDADLSGASMTIANFQSGDSLNFTNANGISGSYDSSSGMLTLTGSATPAQYTAALQSVTFSTTSINPSTRTIDVVADDSAASPPTSNTGVDTANVTIAAPVVTPSGTTAIFLSGGPAVAVDSGVTVSSDDTDLTGATVTISARTLQSGDSLSFNNQNGISGNYSGGVLTLSGSATPAQYQTALQSVTFSTTSTKVTTRSLSIVAIDNSLISNAAAESIKIIGAPIVTASGTTNTFILGGAAVAVDSGVTVSSNDTDLTGATVTISAGTLQSGDSLSFDNQNGISGAYSGGVLTLSGSATPAQYQAALQSVTFSTTSTNTTTRSLSIVAVDNALTSNAAAESVNVSTAASWTNLTNRVPKADSSQMSLLLPNGDVLVHGAGSGGESASWYLLKPDATGGYQNGTWTQTGSMNYQRLYFGVAVLPSGNVFAVGGEYSSSGSDTNTAEIYNLATGTWKLVASDPQSIVGDEPTEVLPNGSVLVGNIVNNGTEIYNPTTNTWSAGGSKIRNDQSDEESWVKLPNGDILSYDIFSSISDNKFEAELYNPTTNTWSDASNATSTLPLLSTPNEGYELGAAVMLPNGNALFTGANGDTAYFNTSTNLWSAGPTMPVVSINGVQTQLTMGDAPAAVMPDGDVLLSMSPAVSGGSFPAPTYFYDLNPTTGVYTNVTPPSTVSTPLSSVNSFETSMLVLPTGQILLNDFTNSPALYTPGGSPSPAWQPTITSFVNNGNGSFTLTGTQLNGLDEGAAYGDDEQMASNYPIVQVTDKITGNVYYATTSNWSSVGVATGSTPETVTVVLPAALGADPFSMVAIANGIASAPITGLAADPTVITPSGVTSTFTLGGTAVAVDSGVTLSSSDTDLTGTTITITNYLPGDALNFTNQSGISGSYSAGVLTLSGSATPAQYQTAIRSITFSTTSNNTSTRSLLIVAVNGALESNPATESVNVTTNPPVVTPSGTTGTYTFGEAPVVVDAGVTVAFAGADLSRATVTISAGTLQSGDTLHFANQNGISGSYSSGVLTLTGSATPAEYQAALQSVTFSTSGTFTNTRSLSIAAISGSQDSNTAVESVNVVIAPPVVTPSGTVSTFTLGGTAAFVDAGLIVQSFDPALTEATVTITNYQPGDTLHFHSQDGLILVSNTGGVLTLSNYGHASATPAEYQAALQTVTFSTTSTVTTTRTLSIVVDDSLASPTTSNVAAESVNVAFPAPVVTPSGSAASYTAGGTPVTVDSDVTVSSLDTDLSGATVTISAGTLQSGDTLSFASPLGSGINGNYSGGVLTLSGSATPAQYQAALQSVTFSSTSTSTTARAISIIAIDNSIDSISAPETVNVSAPVTVAGVYVSGSAWASSFNTYLADNSLGSATYGYALQTGANQLTTLPWTNINQIDVQFSGPVQGIAQGSLELNGGSSGSTPTVTGFTSLGNNTYQWTLSGPLTNNKYAIGVASTGSSFGPAVVDSNGAGISGTFTTGNSSFPSGNGLAGSTFDFFFNVLPGDVDRSANDNPTDINDVRLLASGTRTTSSSYNPYYDVLGAGIINVTTLNTVRPLTGRLDAATPMAPSDSQVGGTTGIVGLELGVQETGSSSSSPPTAAVSHVVSAGLASSSSTSTVTTRTTDSGSGTTSSTIGNRDHGHHGVAAVDEAVSDFDLTDLWAN